MVRKRLPKEDSHKEKRKDVKNDDKKQSKSKKAISNGDSSGKPELRDGKGKFVKGHKCIGGNPYAKAQAIFRKAFWTLLTWEEILRFCGRCIKHANNGKPGYAQLIFNQLCGKTADFASMERIGELEQAVFNMRRDELGE